ncbi:MAG: OmpA family protein [Pseudomonadota bacterium]
MARKLISATSAVAITLSQLGAPVVTMAAASVAIVLALSSQAKSQDLDAANAAVEAARAALEQARENGEGVRQARQALRAARAERERIVAEQQSAQQQQEQRQREAEAQAAAEEQRQREAEAQAAEEEQRQREAEARAAEEEQRQREAEAQAAEEEQRQREAEVRAAEEEQRQREVEAQAAEEEQRQREAEAQAAEEEQRQREAEAQAAEEEQRQREAEAREEEERERAAQTDNEPASNDAQEPQAAESDGNRDEGDSATVTDNESDADRRARRKARREAREGQPPADGPEAKPLAEAPIEQQIEEAAEKPASVVPDELTRSERRRLRDAEQERRQEARNRRQELLGAAGVGAVVGALIPALGGKVVEDEGDRLVVERNGRFFVRKDESALFRDDGRDVEIEQLRNGRTRETITRPNGSKIITVRDPGGYALRRVRVKPNGERIVLFDIREHDRQRRAVNYDRDLPPLRVTIPQDQYIVSGGRYGRSGLADILLAPPVEPVTTGYSLRDVRESNRLRSMVRRVDLDTITFDSGSATVRASQVPLLANIAGGMLDVIDANPAAVFLIEGHTDAVGDELYNLTLSDRRAETVARILVNAFDVPPENLVVQGYGEQYLKIDTLADDRRNRRVAIRNITPLLTASSD